MKQKLNCHGDLEKLRQAIMNGKVPKEFPTGHDCDGPQSHAGRIDPWLYGTRWHSH